jgi:hypothetical protein
MSAKLMGSTPTRYEESAEVFENLIHAINALADNADEIAIAMARTKTLGRMTLVKELLEENRRE